jgi:hypothetical protein
MNDFGIILYYIILNEIWERVLANTFPGTHKSKIICSAFSLKLKKFSNVNISFCRLTLLNSTYLCPRDGGASEETTLTDSIVASEAGLEMATISYC